jgi:hypothetical protein
MLGLDKSDYLMIVFLVVAGVAAGGIALYFAFSM